MFGSDVKGHLRILTLDRERLFESNSIAERSPFRQAESEVPCCV